MARKVQYAAPSTSKTGSFNSNARTWGSLLSENSDLRSAYGEGKAVEAILSPSGHTLSHSEAVLPDGDIKIFLIAKKNKSGALPFKDALTKAITEAVERAQYRDTNIKKAVEEAVVDFFDLGTSPESSEKKSLLNEASKWGY